MGASGSTGGVRYVEGGSVQGGRVGGRANGQYMPAQGGYVQGSTVNGGKYYVQGGVVPANAGYYGQAGPARMGPAPAQVAVQNEGPTLDCTSMCFEPTGGVASQDWQYMGPTRGSYEKVETYQYVGPGGGSVDKVDTVTYSGWRFRSVCMACAALLMVVIIAILVWLLLRGRQVSQQEEVVTETVTFDCDAGFWNWRNGWSYAKKDYCCRTANRACHEEHKVTGDCVLWGDPHIKTFDKSRLVFYSEGDFWIVKSQTIKIQGRFQATDWTKKNDNTDYSSMTSIIVGGPFLGGHKIEVQSMLGKILCDGNDVLNQFGVSYCGSGKIVYNSQGALVDQAMAFLPHKVVHMELPDSLHMQVNRWPNFINAKISMTQQDSQDGVCGNFNGNSGDDMGKELHRRFGQGVAVGELLFAHPIPLHVPQKQPSEKRCGGEVRKRAEEICRKEELHAGWSYAECLGDVCDAHTEHSLQAEDMKNFFQKQG